jgi:hypothetical protein
MTGKRLFFEAYVRCVLRRETGTASVHNSIFALADSGNAADANSTFGAASNAQAPRFGDVSDVHVGPVDPNHEPHELSLQKAAFWAIRDGMYFPDGHWWGFVQGCWLRWCPRDGWIWWGEAEYDGKRKCPAAALWQPCANNSPSAVFYGLTLEDDCGNLWTRNRESDTWWWRPDPEAPSKCMWKSLEDLLKKDDGIYLSADRCSAISGLRHVDAGGTVWRRYKESHKWWWALDPTMRTGKTWCCPNKDEDYSTGQDTKDDVEDVKDEQTKDDVKDVKDVDDVVRS